MARYRKRLSRYSGRRTFKRGARVNYRNRVRKSMRGGTRL